VHTLSGPWTSSGRAAGWGCVPALTLNQNARRYGQRRQHCGLHERPAVGPSLPSRLQVSIAVLCHQLCIVCVCVCVSVYVCLREYVCDMIIDAYLVKHKGKVWHGNKIQQRPPQTNPSLISVSFACSARDPFFPCFFILRSCSLSLSLSLSHTHTHTHSHTLTLSLSARLAVLLTSFV